MAFEQNSKVLAIDYNALKQKIADELARRGVTYEGETVNIGTLTLPEQINSFKDQIDNINENLIVLDPSAESGDLLGTKITDDPEDPQTYNPWEVINTAIETLINDQSGGCTNSGCMGLCTSCTSECANGCSNSCTGGCKGGCGGCGNSCSVACNGCTSDCTGGCRGSCGGCGGCTSCTGTCMNGTAR